MLKGIGEGATYFYHPDHLGSVSVVSNHQGVPYERLEYLPFGEVWIEDVDPATRYIPFRFTSKELDRETGLYYYGARYYEPKVSRWMSADPAGFALINPMDEDGEPVPNGWPEGFGPGPSVGMRPGYSVVEATNWYAYVSNNPVKYVDPTGEEGDLTIEVIGRGLTGGHAWITFTDEEGNTTSYGTWGNNPGGKGNGLHENIERDGNYGSEASRTMHISDEQEDALFSLISEYEEMGAQGWRLMAPCSAFAQDAWEAGTGEQLNANSFLVNNPSTLEKSIIKANGGLTYGTFQDNPTSSSMSSNSISSSASSNGSNSSNGSLSRSLGSSLNSFQSSFGIPKKER